MIDKFLSKIKYARSVSKKVPIPKITNVFAAVFFTIFFLTFGWRVGNKSLASSSYLKKQISPAFLLLLQRVCWSQDFQKNQKLDGYADMDKL